MDPGTDSGEKAVLDDAAGREDVQSRWGVAAMVCAVVGGSLFFSLLMMARLFGKAGAAGAPEWVKPAVLDATAAVVTCGGSGIVSGILGLVQRRRRCEWAAFGLFCCGCELLILYTAK